MKALPFFKVMDRDDPFYDGRPAPLTLAQHIEIAGGWVVRSQHPDVLTGETNEFSVDLSPLKDMPLDTPVMVGVAWIPASAEEAQAWEDAWAKRLGRPLEFKPVPKPRNWLDPTGIAE